MGTGIRKSDDEMTMYLQIEVSACWCYSVAELVGETILNHLAESRTDQFIRKNEEAGQNCRWTRVELS